MTDTKNNYQDTWKSIVNAKNLKEAFFEHFNYLADSPGYEKTLKEISDHVENVKIEDNKLIVTFNNGSLLTATVPADPDKYTDWPESFKKLVQVHEEISFPDDKGWCLILGDHGNFETEFLDESDEEFSHEIKSPVRDYSDWYLYHPRDKNSDGEPGLCFFSHDSCIMDAPVTENAGALFLKRIAEIMQLNLKSDQTESPLSFEPVAVEDLFDPAAERDHIHFAAAHSDYLYTIQEDKLLKVWKISDNFMLKYAGQTTLPVPFPFYDPEFQFSDSSLILRYEYDMVIIDISSPAEPEVKKSVDCDCCWFFTKEAMYIEQRDEGYGICRFPDESDEPDIEIVLPFKDDMEDSSYATMLDDCVCWATQDGLVLTRFSPPEIVTTLRLDNVKAYPLLLNPQRLAILEVYDAGRNALVFVDYDGKKLKKVSAFHKKMVVRCWHFIDNKLYLVLRSSKEINKKREYANSLVIFDTIALKEIASYPLPFIEEYGKAATKIIWLGVQGSSCALLIGNGELHRFELTI